MLTSILVILELDLITFWSTAAPGDLVQGLSKHQHTLSKVSSIAGVVNWCPMVHTRTQESVSADRTKQSLAQQMKLWGFWSRFSGAACCGQSHANQFRSSSKMKQISQTLTDLFYLPRLKWRHGVLQKSRLQRSQNGGKGSHMMWQWKSKLTPSKFKCKCYHRSVLIMLNTPNPWISMYIPPDP